MTGFRPDATELDDARCRVEALVCDLPQRPGEKSFEEPWELRAFAMAVAAHDSGQYEWPEFQRSLIESIRKWEAEGGDAEATPWSYYEHWLTALETVLADHGALPDAALDDRTREVLATPRAKNHHEPHYEPVAIDPAR